MFSRCPACGSRRRPRGRRGRCRRCGNPLGPLRMRALRRAHLWHRPQPPASPPLDVHPQRAPMIGNLLRVGSSVSIGRRGAIAIGVIHSLAAVLPAVSDLRRPVPGPTVNVEDLGGVLDSRYERVTGLIRAQRGSLPGRAAGRRDGGDAQRHSKSATCVSGCAHNVTLPRVRGNREQFVRRCPACGARRRRRGRRGTRRR